MSLDLIVLISMTFHSLEINLLKAQVMRTMAFEKRKKRNELKEQIITNVI